MEKRKSDFSKTKYIALMSMFLGLAVIMGYVEAIVPFTVGIPGIKLGLANLVTLIILYSFDYKSGLLVGTLRVLIVGFLFMNLSMIIYSLAGFIISFSLMHIMRSIGIFSQIGVSMIGGVAHNMVQLIIAAIMMEISNNSVLLYYFPFLLISGLVAGFLIGLVSLPLGRAVDKLKVV